MELKFKVEQTRRLEKNRKRLRQNGLFQRDAGRFYRELGKQTIQVTHISTISAGHDIVDSRCDLIS